MEQYSTRALTLKEAVLLRKVTNSLSGEIDLESTLEFLTLRAVAGFDPGSILSSELGENLAECLSLLNKDVVTDVVNNAISDAESLIDHARLR